LVCGQCGIGDSEPTRNQTGERFRALLDRRTVCFPLQIGAHHVTADLARRGIGDDTLQSLTSLDAHVPGSRLVVLPWYHQEHCSRIAPGIADIGLEPDAPAAADLAGNIRFILIADAAECDHGELCSGGALQLPQQRLQLLGLLRLQQVREVVDVSHRLRRDERVDPRQLRQHRSNDCELKHRKESGSFGACAAQSVACT